MSKVGKLPIEIANGINVTITGSVAQVSGPKGNASMPIPQGVTVEVADGRVQVSAKNTENKAIRALFGLTRANLANIMKGVDSGFEKKLEMAGVGYRAQVQGADLVLSVGYSHPVKITPFQGVQFAVTDNVITVSGIDKSQVGEIAARVRAVRPPEPYKGKGIKYQGERVRRKAGKAAKAAGAK